MQLVVLNNIMLISTDFSIFEIEPKEIVRPIDCVCITLESYFLVTIALKV